MTLVLSLAVLAVIFVAMLLRAVFGFGDSMFAVPLLAAMIGLDQGAPVLALAGTVLALLLLRERPSAIERAPVLRMLAGALLGIPLGLAVLVEVPETWAHRGLGALLIAFALTRLLRRPRRLDPSEAPPPAADARRARAVIRDLGFGLLTGASSAAFNIAGPPLLAYAALRGWSGDALRVNFQALFLPLGVLTLLGHGAAGLWTREVLLLAGLAIPVMLIAYALGPKLRERIGARLGPEGGQRGLLLVILGLGLFELIGG